MDESPHSPTPSTGPPTGQPVAASPEVTHTVVTGSEPAPPAPRSVPGPPPAPPKKKGSGGSFLKELPVLIVIAFGLALLIKTFLLQAFFIPSESMVPTLKVGDRVLVNKLVYRIHPPRRGDIIVFIEQQGPSKSFWGRVRSFLTEGLGVTKPAQRDFIKRVIALPGETIQISKGVVSITTKGGKTFSLSEPYLNSDRDLSSYGPFTVPADSYFVMGDNRTNSADSRTALGPIRREVIVGRAFVRIWPLGRFGFFHRPHYAGSSAAGAAAVAPVFVLAAGAVVRRRRAA
jgi:signal peptidase I